MTFNQLIKQRYSCRDYLDKQIEKEKLNQVLEAGNLAPTAKNNQPQRIYVLQSKEALEKIRQETKCAFNAPVVLLICYDEKEEWNNPLEEGIHSGVEDASIVATHMMLEATELGLGTCWVNVFPNSHTREVFNLPENIKPVLLMTIGYPSEKGIPSERHTLRKELKDTVKYL